MDESKPHLHISFSYYNIDLNKWNQRELRDKKLTDLNLILKDFERDIGKKYGLVKGDNAKLKQEIKKEFKGTKYKVKTGFLKTEEKILLNRRNLNNAINNIYKRVKKIGTEKRYQKEIIRLKKQYQQEIQKLKEEYNKKIVELKQTNEELLNMLDKDIQEHNKKVQEIKKDIKDIKEKHKKELHEKNMLIKQLQDKVKELESLIPPPKKQDLGIDF
jgi:chromosome segregation ATPase